MNALLKTTFAAAGILIATQAAAQVTFYERENFDGRSFTTQRKIGNFERFGFNDRASSVVVKRDRWEVCDDSRFNGRCIILRPGRYASLASMGMNDRISSVRQIGRKMRIDDNRYAPAPLVSNNYRRQDNGYAQAPVVSNAYQNNDNRSNDYRRRNNEHLYEANVTSVRAVVGPAEQRCWIEKEQVVQNSGNTNVPATVVGAVIGGILGHQVGNGRGQDLATAGGAVAGAAVGANVGRDSSQQVRTQDVQRCSTTTNQARPDHWDVTYNFRNLEHRVQLTSPPGTTITVNEQGEPRK